MFFLEIDQCNPNPCKNGGTCKKQGSTYKCECTAEFQGRDCATGENCLFYSCFNQWKCFDFYHNRYIVVVWCTLHFSWVWKYSLDKCVRPFKHVQELISNALMSFYFQFDHFKKRTLSTPTLGPSGSQGLHHRTLSRSTHTKRLLGTVAMFILDLIMAKLTPVAFIS